MAVTPSSSNSAAAARAAEEARRRAEEARRRAEEARRRAEEAKQRAAEAAKQAKAQQAQQQKLESESKKLQEKLKAHKPDDTQARNLKDAAEKVHKELSAEQRNTKKAVERAEETQKSAKDADARAQKASEDAQRAQDAAQKASARERLAREGSQDGAKDEARRVRDAASRPERSLGEKLKDAAVDPREVDAKDAEKLDAKGSGPVKGGAASREKLEQQLDRETRKAGSPQQERGKEPTRSERAAAEKKTETAKAHREDAKDAVKAHQKAQRETDEKQEQLSRTEERLAAERKKLAKLEKETPSSRVYSEHDTGGNRAEKLGAQQEKIDALAQKAKTQREEVDQAKSVEEKARQLAVDAQDKAIKSMQAANQASERASEDAPFKGVEGLNGSADLASRSAKEQQQVLGTKSSASVKEAAAADAEKVAAAAEKSPEAAARVLNQELGKNEDLAYREALFAGSKGAIDKAVQGAMADPDQQVLNDTVKELSKAADLVGPSANQQLGTSLQQAASAGEIDFEEGNAKLQEALKANADTAVGRNAARGVADAFRAAGGDGPEHADAIGKLHPKLKSAAAEDTGQSKAREAAQVQTVSGQREQAEEQDKSLRAEAKKQHEQITQRAEEIKGEDGAKSRERKDGTTVTTTENHRVIEDAETGETTVQRLDKEGKVAQSNSTQRDGDVYRISSTEYSAKGKASRTTIEAGGDWSNRSSTTWKENRSATPKTPPTNEEIKAGEVKGATIQEEAYDQDGANLKIRTYSQSARGGAEEMIGTFSTQEAGDKDGGLDDNFDDRFDSDEPIDRFNSTTTSIPPKGQQDAEGNPAVPTVTTSQTFGQEGVKATSTKTTTPEDFEGYSASEDPTLSDVESVKADGQEILAEDDPEKHPKSWTLDVNTSASSMESQSFVEGQQNLTSITTREAHGSTVNETITNKYPEEEGQASETTSTTSTTFDRMGRTVNREVETENRDGSTTSQTYALQRERTARGLIFTEQSQSTVTDADGNASTQEKTTRSLAGKDGPQLLSSKAKTTDAWGNTSTATIDEDGKAFTYNGQPISPSDLAGMSESQAQTAGASISGALADVKKYASYGGKALSALSQTLDFKAGGLGVNGSGTLDEAVSDLIAEYEADAGPGLVKANQAAFGLAAGASVATGVLGAVSSGASLVDSIRDGNIGAIAYDAAGVASGALGAFQGATQLAGLADDALAAGSKLATAGSLAGKLAGGLGVATAAYSFGATMLDANATTTAKVQAGVGLAGAAASLAVGAALGGPAGLAVAVAAIGVQQLVGVIGDDEHALADVEI